MNAIYRLQVIMEMLDRASGPARMMTARLQAIERASLMASAGLERLQTAATLAGAGAALAAPLVLATGAAMRFEEAWADVRKVVDASPGALKELQGQLLALSRTIPLSATQLTQIAAAAGQAGIAVEEIAAFTRDAARVATAFGLDAFQAGDALAKLRNILGLTQPQVMAVADAVNHLSNNLAATAPEILEVLRRVGGTGKLLGLTGQQVAAFSASLLALGTAPEVAATGLNALFQRLATAPSQPRAFQEALSRLGLTAQGLQAALRRDAASAIMDFLGRLQAVPDQLTVLSDLFGMEYADDVAKLVGSLDTLRRAMGLVADPAQYAGSVLAEFQNRSATLQNQLTLLRNALERLWITIGNELLPVVTPVVERLTGFLNRVSDLLDRFPLLRRGVILVSAVLGGLLVVGGALVAALGALGFALGQARLGLLALQGAAGNALRSLRLLSLGLALLRAQAASLGAMGLLQAGLARLAALAQGAGRAFLFLGRAMLLNPLGLLLAGLTALGYALYRAWRSSESFRASVLGTLEALKGAFAPVVAEFRALGRAVVEALAPVRDGIQRAFLGALPALDALTYALGYGLGFVFGLLQGLVERLAPVFSEGLMGAVGVLRGFVELVVGLFTLDLDRARQGALRVWEGLKAVLSVPLRLGGVAWDALKGGMEKALGWLRGLVERMREVGGQLVRGLVEGIKSWAMAPVRAVENLASSVWEAIRQKLGIRSPSRVMAHLGAMAALGLAVGLQDMTPQVARAAEGLAQAAVPRVEVPEVPLPKLPEAALPVRVLLPEVRPPAFEAAMGVVARVPEVALPPLPEVPPPPSQAPAPPEPSRPAPPEARQVQQVIRIERLELPGVRDAEGFLEELKKLFLPYLEV